MTVIDGGKYNAVDVRARLNCNANDDDANDETQSNSRKNGLGPHRLQQTQGRAYVEPCVRGFESSIPALLTLVMVKLPMAYSTVKS